MPSTLPNQSDTLHTARSAAAEGYLSTFTISLLADPETLVQTARLNWTQTLAKAKVKARVNQLTKVKARAKKDKAKDKANLKAKKNVHPPLLLPYMPQQPKGKARNNVKNPTSAKLLRSLPTQLLTAYRRLEVQLPTEN